MLDILTIATDLGVSVLVTGAAFLGLRKVNSFQSDLKINEIQKGWSKQLIIMQDQLQTKQNQIEKLDNSQISLSRQLEQAKQELQENAGVESRKRVEELTSLQENVSSQLAEAYRFVSEKATLSKVLKEELARITKIAEHKSEIADNPKHDLKPHPDAVVLEVRGHWLDKHVTVTYGRLINGQVFEIEGKPWAKICCIRIPDELPDAHLSNVAMEQIINPLPPGWAHYLLTQNEAKV